MSETQDFTACPQWGHGGRYVIDPETGERKAAVDEPETAQAPAAPAAEPLPAFEAAAAAATDKPARKGK